MKKSLTYEPRKYNRVAMLPEGVWNQTALSTVFDKKRHADDSTHVFPEKLTMYSHFPENAVNLESVVNDPSKFIDPTSPEFKESGSNVYFNWGDIDSEVNVYTRAKYSLTEKETKVAEAAHLSEDEIGILKSVMDSDIIVLGPRSQEFKQYVDVLDRIYSTKPMKNQSPDIVSLTKGIFIDYTDNGKPVRVRSAYEILQEDLPDRLRKAIMVGPNISTEIREYIPAISVTASSRSWARMIKGKEYSHQNFHRDLANFFQSYNFGTVSNENPDPIGWATSVKNIIAIANGMSNYHIEKTVMKNTGRKVEGKDHNANMSGILLTLGLRDNHYGLKSLMDRNIVKWKDVDTANYLLSFAALGDTITTAISPNSRNVRFGYEFAKALDENPGLEPAQKEELVDKIIKENIEQAVEGVAAVKEINEIIDAFDIHAPFFKGVYMTLFGNWTPEKFSDKMYEFTGSPESHSEKLMTKPHFQFKNLRKRFLG